MDNRMALFLVLSQVAILVIGVLFVWYQRRLALQFETLTGELVYLIGRVDKSMREKDDEKKSES